MKAELIQSNRSVPAPSKFQIAQKWGMYTLALLTFPLSGIAYLVHRLFQSMLMHVIMNTKELHKSKKTVELSLITPQSIQKLLPGESLHGKIGVAFNSHVEFFYHRSSKASADSPTVLICPGNANSTHNDLKNLIQNYLNMGVHVAFFHYRGTQKSGNVPRLYHPTHVLSEIQSITEILKSSGVSSQQLIFHGYSAGSYFAAEAASIERGAHLVIDRGFQNAQSIAADRAGFFAGKLTAWFTPLSTELSIKKVQGHIKILSSQKDETMNEARLDHGKKLFAAATSGLALSAHHTLSRTCGHFTQLFFDKTWASALYSLKQAMSSAPNSLSQENTSTSLSSFNKTDGHLNSADLKRREETSHVAHCRLGHPKRQA